jgi:hypothetical protein
MAGAFRGPSIIGWVLLALVSTDVRSQDAAIDRLEGLGNALRQNEVWQADFDQEFVSVGMTKGEKATGRVWLSWPDRALFHTGKPPFRLMGFEGRVVRLVDLEASTCDEHGLTDREWERVPLAAVLDPSGAQLHFTVAEKDADGVVLTPREPGGVKQVDLVLGPHGLPHAVVIEDPGGAVNRLRFTGWAPADHPPSDAWLPTPPENIDCVTDPSPLD